MSDSVYGYNAIRLAAIIEQLDEVRADLKSLKADPIEIVPSVSGDDFKPKILINDDGSLTLALLNRHGEDNDLSYDLHNLIADSITGADSDALEGFIVYFSKLLALAAGQRANY